VRPEADATVVSRPAAKRPPKAAREPSEALLKARHALASGALGHAASQYGELIRRGDELDLIIEDLTSATRRHASSVGLWRTLGDAYKKAGRVQEALKAYERGMEETHVLDNARRALRSGDIERAATEYGVLIKRKLEIGTVITELRDYLESEPQVPVLWQILGDAYMKADRLPEAIEAYRRGMEVA
jgi:predicted Zn-dependent protease